VAAIEAPAPRTANRPAERRLIASMRLILVAGGLFVLVAGVQLFAFSTRTDELFAWTIASPMSASFLGAFYLSAGVLALLSASESTWARARLGVPGVLAFVWLTLLATLLHLDLFHLDEGGFKAELAAWVWLVIYVLEAPVLSWAFVAQLRAAGGDPPRPNTLPPSYRTLTLALSVPLVAFGVALFVAPLDVGDAWPWTLTELTGRAIAAWLVALGGMLAAVWWENERGRIRIALAALLTLVALQGIALARYGEELDWGSAAATVYVACLPLLLAVGAWGWRISTG
jgi:hypothetical protein